MTNSDSHNPFIGRATVQGVNNRFDKTIANAGYSGKMAEIEKELFNLSLGLKISDWKKIRGKEYWIKRDAIKQEMDQQLFTLYAVRQYVNNK